MLNILMIIVGLSYTYFWFWLILSWINPDWFKATRKNTYFLTHKFVNLTFQFTTKGGNPEILQKGINEILKSKLDENLYSILIVTEELSDVKTLTKLYKNKNIDYLVVEKDYETANKTKFKARGLQRAIEYYKENDDISNQHYIVHYDEESVIKADKIPLLYYRINNAYRDGLDIVCGQIYYPLEYYKANVFSRAMEANRAFIEPECAAGLITGLPKQGHGSNMAVRSTTEYAVNWDIGLANNYPIISEDILFLIKAKAKGVQFGWHGVPMLEQPAFTIEQSQKQRYRWVFGSLQALSVVRNMLEWNMLTWWEKFNMSTAIALRCFSYGLGFIIGLISLIINMISLVALFFGYNLYGIPTWFSIIFLAMWLGAYIYGIFMNIKYTSKSFTEYLKILIIAPVAGLLETYPALKAFFDWYVLQKRSVEWKPTLKQL